MQVRHRNIDFDLEKTIREEVPYVATLARKPNGEPSQQVLDLLEFPLKEGRSMPFYTVHEENTYHIGKVFEQTYQAMYEAARFALRNREHMMRFYDCAFMRKHGHKFASYALATMERQQPALYGRFDASFDHLTEQVTGIYEFNGDTPVMLFESVSLENRFVSNLGGDQYNNWWHESVDAFSEGYKDFAVVCSHSYIDDLATSDTIAQMLQTARPQRRVQMLDVQSLDFDHANIHKPWVASHNDHHLDAVYVLLPWEEMVESFPQMLDTWERWADNVHFFEPAWRWFMSHKGCMSLVTWMLENIPTYKDKFGHLPFIETRTWLPKKGKWVEKPVIGRLSSNIRIHGNGELLSTTAGGYGTEKTVFQKYVSPAKVGERNNSIMCMWMSNAPGAAGFNKGGSAATLCFREFDEEVLSLANERFIPHIVI